MVCLCDVCRGPAAGLLICWGVCILWHRRVFSMGWNCQHICSALLASTCHCRTASKPFLLQGHSFVFPQPNEGSPPSHSPEGVVPGSSTFAGSALCLFHLFRGVTSIFIHNIFLRIDLVIIFIYRPWRIDFTNYGGQIMR